LKIKGLMVCSLLFISTILFADDTVATNVIPVHLGGFVQDIDPPDISFSNSQWSVDDENCTTSIFNTTMQLRSDEKHLDVPVKLAMQVSGYLGNYAITVKTNSATQTVSDATLPVALDSLGSFSASASGVNYPLEIDYTDNTHVMERVHGNITFYTYYQT